MKFGSRNNQNPYQTSDAFNGNIYNWKALKHTRRFTWNGTLSFLLRRIKFSRRDGRNAKRLAGLVSLTTTTTQSQIFILECKWCAIRYQLIDNVVLLFFDSRDYSHPVQVETPAFWRSAALRTDHTYASTVCIKLYWINFFWRIFPLYAGGFSGLDWTAMRAVK